jgi:hypothetical protein
MEGPRLVRGHGQPGQTKKCERTRIEGRGSGSPVTKTEIEKAAKSIVSKITRRGNDQLSPRLDGDGITVDYVTDCDRYGDVDGSEGGFLIGYPKKDRQAVVDKIVELNAKLWK